MRLRNLFTPSFRNRLRLFFVIIVVVPMIAVALVLFQIVTRSEESQTDAQLSEAQRVATNLYRASADRANAAGQEIVDDDGLREAIADGEPANGSRARLDAAARGRPRPAAVLLHARRVRGLRATATSPAWRPRATRSSTRTASRSGGS